MFFKLKAFTLIEIIVVIVIIAVLGTVLAPAYFNALEKSKSVVCETNQKVLLGALEMYAVENTVLPASLSYLPQDKINRAWVKILSQPGAWKIRLAYAIADFNLKQAVYAANSWLSEYINKSGPACPADPTPPPVNFSYGLSSEFAGQPTAVFFNASMDALVIADSDTAEFNEPVARHTSHGLLGASKFAIAITRGSEIIHYPEDIDNMSSDGWRNRGQCISWCHHRFKGCGNNQACKAERADCCMDCSSGPGGHNNTGNGDDGDDGDD